MYVYNSLTLIDSYSRVLVILSKGCDFSAQARKRAGKKYKTGPMSFGAKLDIPQVRVSPDLEVAWMLKYQQDEDKVELIPIRPFITMKNPLKIIPDCVVKLVDPC